jgi:hypothetical protein
MHLVNLDQIYPYYLSVLIDGVKYYMMYNDQIRVIHIPVSSNMIISRCWDPLKSFPSDILNYRVNILRWCTSKPLPCL